jgi:hypothetical protein
MGRKVRAACCLVRSMTEGARNAVFTNIVVVSLADGEYSNPARVVAFNIAEGWSRDVTEAIAEAVAERGRSENHFGKAAKEFIERTLGVFVG